MDFELLGENNKKNRQKFLCLEYDGSPFVGRKIIGGDSKTCKVSSETLDLIYEFKKYPNAFICTNFFDKNLQKDFDDDYTR